LQRSFDRYGHFLLTFQDNLIRPIAGTTQTSAPAVFHNGTIREPVYSSFPSADPQD
jgi:hypothetical protein